MDGLNDTVVRQVEYAVSVKGQGAVQDLQAALRGVEADIRAASRQYAATGDILAYEDATKKLTAAQASLSAQIRLANSILEEAALKVQVAAASAALASQTYDVLAQVGVKSSQALADAAGVYVVGANSATGATRRFADSVTASADMAALAALANLKYGDSVEKVDAETVGAAAANRMYAETLDAMAGKAVTAATQTTRVHVGMQDGTRAGRTFAGGLTQVAYALDDLQYGLVAVVNNIPGLARGIGIPDAWAGALGIAAVAGNQFAKQVLPSILEAFTDAKVKGADPYLSSMENLQERIKELEKKPLKIAVEREELDAAKRSLKEMTEALEAFDAIRTGRSKHERESESAVKEILADPDKGGGKAVTDALKARAVAHLEETDPTIAAARERIAAAEATIEGIRNGPGGEGATEEADALRREVSELVASVERRKQQIRGKGGLAEKAVGDILGPAKAGEDVTEHQEQLARELEFAGKGDLAAEIRQKPPAAMRATEENKERAKKKKEANEDRERLTQQGIDYEFAGKQELNREVDEEIARLRRIGLPSSRSDAQKSIDDRNRIARRAQKDRAEKAALPHEGPAARAARIARAKAGKIKTKTGIPSGGGPGRGIGRTPKVPAFNPKGVQVGGPRAALGAGAAGRAGLINGGGGVDDAPWGEMIALMKTTATASEKTATASQKMAADGVAGTYSA